ncbi:hypothetical protein AMTRI_Chr03g50730 [Amborella trichopoda]
MNFLWSGEHDNNYHLIAWPKLCMPKTQGGLGIHNLKAHNSALLGKWWWRYARQPNQLWREVIKHKYCYGVNHWTPNCRTNGAISRFSRSHKHFSGFIHFCPREGSRMLFWDAKWVGRRPLRELLTSIG